VRGAATLRILAIGVPAGGGHEQITHLQWEAVSSSGLTSTEALIAWLRQDPEHEAWLLHDGRPIGVEVVTPIGAPAYLRSRSDGAWGDHLLALPRL
jgi:uncharacterized protein DUF3892